MLVADVCIVFVVCGVKFSIFFISLSKQTFGVIASVVVLVAAIDDNGGE